MSTVGYGDYFPTTFPGRVMAFIVCILGVLTTSLITVSIGNELSLELLENKSYYLLQRIQKKEQLYSISLKISNILTQYYIASKRRKMNAQTILNLRRQKKQYQKQLYRLGKEFIRMKRKYLNISDGSSTSDQLNNLFYKMNNQMEEISEKSKNLSQLQEQIINCLDHQNSEQKSKPIQFSPSSTSSLSLHDDITSPSGTQINNYKS